ncbi:uncharacterized protein Bfra_005787 [Botrytis fragariae]|uniref:Uncharacterized protein n=1 Tax=Botrytis fragariae TaxID=1964551 RepID=A0A8H6ARX7_9HELO|nr:uncharacterized protein Bfra_005787 [Botrytis fragariae]KAF5872428.1 hypothetical protein Bfra_005787 [Botrytis fragariae]
MAWAPMMISIIALHGEHGRNDDDVNTDQVSHSAIPHLGETKKNRSQIFQELPQAIMSDPEWNDTPALILYLLGRYRTQGKSTENT